MLALILICLWLVGAQPVVASQPTSISGTKSFIHNFEATEVDRLGKSGIKISSGTTNNYLKINSGNILLSPDKDIVVGTDNGDVWVGGGAIVFIIKSGEDLAIYDLRQSASNQVKLLISDKDQLTMEPGCMLVVTKQDIPHSEELVSASHSINFWNAVPVKLNEKGLNAFVAEFSIMSALQRIEPLQQLLASNDKADQLVVEKIMKVAAIMGDITPTKESAKIAATVKGQKLAGKKNQLSNSHSEL